VVLRAQIDPNTVIVGELNTSQSPIDRQSMQKINRETLVLLYTVEQIEMIDSYRAFHPTTRQYIFFSEAHETFSKIDHILGHKASLNKFKKIK
jgi:exonuclease III